MDGQVIHTVAIRPFRAGDLEQFVGSPTDITEPNLRARA